VSVQSLQAVVCEGRCRYLDDIPEHFCNVEPMKIHPHASLVNADTYGKMDNSASVIPRPARNTGVRPILGLIVEPTNGPTGDCYTAFRLKPGNNSMSGEAYPGHGLLLEIAGGFDCEDGADIMDPLERCVARTQHTINGSRSGNSSFTSSKCKTRRWGRTDDAQSQRTNSPDGTPSALCPLA
jgi:hypothetical protein